MLRNKQSKDNESSYVGIIVFTILMYVLHYIWSLTLVKY